MTGMNVACDDIETYENRNVCDAAVVRPISTTSTNLGDSTYTTNTDVHDGVKIALDLVQIRDAFEKGSFVKDIHRSGENSLVYHDGIVVRTRSLQGFSIVALSHYWKCRRNRLSISTVTVYEIRIINILMEMPV